MVSRPRDSWDVYSYSKRKDVGKLNKIIECWWTADTKRRSENLKKGDTVVFIIGNNPMEYRTITDEYELLGRKVVDLEGYAGEVAVEYLKKVAV